ncbi:MAG TPA: glycoside hydrolase family 76 protein [Candidatus Nanopelagicales bacterium]
MTDPPSPWAARADELQESLAQQFWLPRRQLFRLRTGAPLWPWGRWSYWWQAHALDAMVDAYARRPDERLRQRILAHVAGIVRRGHGSAVNDFYDDMGWLALALLHLGDVSAPAAPQAHELIGELLPAIQTGASDVCGGGIAWATRHPDFKNVPATATGAIAAVRRGTTIGDAAVVGWGTSLVEWIHRTLVEDGVVWDGTHSRADGSCELERAEYTYTYGLVVGADTLLYGVTGAHAYLDRARSTAATALSRMTDPQTGLWRAEGSADGGLFRGILARFLGDLAVETSDVDLADVLRHNANAAWLVRDAVGLVGADWTRCRGGRVTLSEHLSAVLLTEQCARLAVVGT